MSNTVETLDHPQYLDAQWHARADEIAGFSLITKLRGRSEARASQKEAFIAGDIENPTFDYSNIDMQKLAEAEEQLLKLKQAILLGEPNPVVAQLYRWKINTRIASNRILQAAYNGDQRKFAIYSWFIYGNPEPELFSAAAGEVVELIRASVDPNDTEVRGLVATIEQNLPVSTSSKLILPSPELFKTVKEMTHDEFSAALKDLVIPENVGFTEVEETMNQVFGNLDLSDWSVKPRDAEFSTASVSESKKTVNVPGLIEYMRDRFIGLMIFHEVGTHALREVNGAKTKLKLLKDGLDRYLLGEEGLGILREQVAYPNFEDFRATPRWGQILDRYVAIGLAYGVDGKPRNFREVYEIIYPIKLIRNIAEGITKDEAEKLASDEAWELCVRVLKGTGSGQKGAAFTKDLTYLAGGQQTWQTLSESVDAMKDFNLGKFDQNSSRHRKALGALGIIN